MSYFVWVGLVITNTCSWQEMYMVYGIPLYDCHNLLIHFPFAHFSHVPFFFVMKFISLYVSYVYSSDYILSIKSRNRSRGSGCSGVLIDVARALKGAV